MYLAIFVFLVVGIQMFESDGVHIHLRHMSCFQLEF